MSDTPADLLRQYHAAKDNGEDDRAATLWQQYLAAVATEMREKARAA